MKKMENKGLLIAISAATGIAWSLLRALLEIFEALVHSMTSNPAKKLRDEVDFEKLCERLFTKLASVKEAGKIKILDDEFVTGFRFKRDVFWPMVHMVASMCANNILLLDDVMLGIMFLLDIARTTGGNIAFFNPDIQVSLRRALVVKDLAISIIKAGYDCPLVWYMRATVGEVVSSTPISGEFDEWIVPMRQLAVETRNQDIDVSAGEQCIALGYGMVNDLFDVDAPFGKTDAREKLDLVGFCLTSDELIYVLAPLKNRRVPTERKRGYDAVPVLVMIGMLANDEELVNLICRGICGDKSAHDVENSFGELSISELKKAVGMSIMSRNLTNDKEVALLWKHLAALVFGSIFSGQITRPTFDYYEDIKAFTHAVACRDFGNACLAQYTMSGLKRFFRKNGLYHLCFVHFNLLCIFICRYRFV